MVFKPVVVHPLRVRVSVLPLILLLLAGCGESRGQVKVDRELAEDYSPSSKPSMADMLKVTAPGYKTPAGSKQECFGRMIFDVAATVEWPTHYRGDSEFLFYRSFSEKVADRGDEMTFGDTKIAVIGPTTPQVVARLNSDGPSGMIKFLEGRIADKRAYLKGLKAEKLTASREASERQDVEDQIRGLEKTIGESRKGFENFAPGLPDSSGYWKSSYEANDETNRYSIFRAYLIRAAYVYVFESQRKMGNQSNKDVHKQNFSSMLKNFRTRKLNEIPTELGVCVPHGFIPDDGTTPSEFKQSLRWPDAPGVVYTLETGNVHPRRMKSTAMEAATKAAIGTPGSGGEEDEVKDFVTKRIGPRSYKIGGLTGEQGGVVLTVKRPGKETYEAYSLFTGYSGWLGTAVLPYITVDMHTYTKEQAPELKQNPPPFQHSMDRLDLMLKSMRLRPTNPPMPDFANPPK
jgi:hypothetical protein